MLLVLEKHHVKGSSAPDFDATFQEGAALLATSSGARLAWYFDVAHGTGPSYVAISAIAMKDLEVWHALAERISEGDLSAWSRKLESLRYSRYSETFVASSWSWIETIPIENLPLAPTAKEKTMFLLEYVWPTVPIADYMLDQERLWGGARPLSQSGCVQLMAACTTIYGAGRRSAAMFLKKIIDLESFRHFISGDTADGSLQTYYAEQNAHYGAIWDSYLLRTSSWSPLK